MRTVEKNEQRKWTAPTLEFKGTVGEILKGGGGKQSTTPYDPGEVRCPPAFCGHKNE